ncbi:MAG: hypothetical protein HY011_08805 [Acidobacteria bacterium]|nr:hypothetical protein [Acidobacteriota bacterium]
MSVKTIAKALEEALLHDGQMAQALYEFEFEEELDDLKASLLEDDDDYLFSITENNGDIAMVLLEKAGDVLINEQAREKLKEFWRDNYTKNIELIIPDLAEQLDADELPITGVKLAR